MHMSQRWPERLWIVRHGESQGNVARDAAQAARATHIETGGRDVDVPLSQLGQRQSQALGRWFADLPEAERPEVIFCSPYLRARPGRHRARHCPGSRRGGRSKGVRASADSF
jgi:phosphohistidine phosphatase SixA